MPELPEVETTRLGLIPFCKGQVIEKIVIRNPSLRWPIESSLKHRLQGQTIHDIKRRAKYLLFELDHGTLIGHLGMSGHFKVKEPLEDWLKHDHFAIELANHSLRLNDPRRFGAILYTENEWKDYPKFAHLGPEPLERVFNAQYLLKAMHKRSTAIKPTLMDNKIVVGVGNIYACEALFRAKISPHKSANQLSLDECKTLVSKIKQVLKQAIQSGGTTLKDFQHSEGKLGYFGNKLKVYGRYEEPCEACFGPIAKVVMGQRSTFYCPNCQV